MDDAVLTKARAAVLTLDAADLAAAAAGLDGHPHPAAPLWRGLCRVLDETGERDLPADRLHRLVDSVLAAAEGLDEPARAAAHAACAFRLIRADALERSLAELARAVVLLEDGPPGADAAVACELVAYTSTIAAPTWEGMVWTERALAAARQGAPPEIVELVRSRFALRLLSIAEDLAAIGDHDQARELGRRALALYEELWHASTERPAELAVNLAFCHLLLDQVEPVAPLLDPFLDYPDPWMRALAHLGTGRALAAVHDDERAVVHLETAAAQLRADRERWHLTFALQAMLGPLARLGRFDEMRRVADDAVTVARRISYDHQRRFEVAVRARVRELAADERAHLADTAATTDPVTTLANRRGFDRRLAGLVAAPPGRATFAVVDVDRFKAVNDRYGHLVGDAVLREVALVLRSCVRSTDLVARWAGDEFAAVLLDADDATRVLERVRSLVEAFDWNLVQPGLAVTVTIGAVERAAGESPGDTLRRADHALLHGKRSGRNCVVRHDSVPGSPDGC